MQRGTVCRLLIAAAMACGMTSSARGQVSQSEIDRLRIEIAELQRRVKAQEAEIDRLRKLAGLPATQPAATQKAATTQKAVTTRAAVAQDGPGLYRVSAGSNGRFTTTVRAKSREDAISIAMKTVAQRAMDNDENVDIGSLKVERVGP